MLVHFVVLQTDGKTTREAPLFDEEWSLLQVGLIVKANGRRFIIDSTQWLNREQGTIKAICKEFIHPYSKQARDDISDSHHN